MPRIMSVGFIAGGVFAVAVAVAAPASADHVVDVTPDGSSCRWGAITQPVGLDLWTEKVKLHHNAAGEVTRYTCHFKDIPEYVSTYDEMKVPKPQDWHLPQRTLFFHNIECWEPRHWLHGGPGPWGTATGMITPAGTGKITCVLPG